MPTLTPSALCPWEPLLDGAQAEAALASVHEIAAVLGAHFEDYAPSPEKKVYLGEGAAGIAVFFAYLQAAGHSPVSNLAFECLGLSIEAVANQAMGPSLFSGFTGIVWAAVHISNLLVDSSDDPGTDIDLALETYLSRSPWTEDYDLINGLTGLGVYSLERIETPGAVRCLELIVERLAELAEHSHDELCWFTAPDLLPQSQREIHPQGCYNLGLAHGAPGVIALLGKIHAAGIACEKAGRLLEGAVNWLMRQRLSEDADSSFAAFLVPGRAPEACRLAWCYGDAGIAAALFLAARCTGSAAWENAALAVARRAAKRDPQGCGVVDPCFCHGSSGLAHIFNRFYHATHDQLFAEAARFWIQKTLQFRSPGNGAAGYSVMATDDDGAMGFQKRFGVIEGIAGIGLTLLAAISRTEPNWDRIFMVDIPPRPAAQP